MLVACWLLPLEKTVDHDAVAIMSKWPDRPTYRSRAHARTNASPCRAAALDWGTLDLGDLSLRLFTQLALLLPPLSTVNPCHPANTPSAASANLFGHSALFVPVLHLELAALALATTAAAAAAGAFAPVLTQPPFQPLHADCSPRRTPSCRTSMMSCSLWLVVTQRMREPQITAGRDLSRRARPRRLQAKQSRSGHRDKMTRRKKVKRTYSLRYTWSSCSISASVFDLNICVHGSRLNRPSWMAFFRDRLLTGCLCLASTDHRGPHRRTR